MRLHGAASDETDQRTGYSTNQTRNLVSSTGIRDCEEHLGLAQESIHFLSSLHCEWLLSMVNKFTFN